MMNYCFALYQPNKQKVTVRFNLTVTLLFKTLLL